jgi:putative transposase
LKQFKTGEDLYGNLAQLQKRGIGKMLVDELDAHLGYDMREKTTNPNALSVFSFYKKPQNSV